MKKITFLTLTALLFLTYNLFAQHYALIGTALTGGTDGYGTVFRYDLLTGKDTALVNFDYNTNGEYPVGTLIQNPNDGLLYGMNQYDGINGGGVLFSVDPKTGKDSVRFSFTEAINGLEPYQGNLTWYNNKYYGMIWGGGLNDSGVIFSFNPVGNKDSVLLNFTHKNNGEYNPWGTYLTPYKNGLMYAMTYAGGTGDSGTIFSFNPITGKDSVVVNLNQSTGYNPEEGALIINPKNGLLYSVNYSGGTADSGTLFSFDPKTGVYTVLVNFNDTLGGYPAGDLMYDSLNGKFYGMTNYGGPFEGGVIYSYDPSSGKDTVLHTFSGPDGAIPNGNLIMGPGGLMYGLTYYGGTSDSGVIFSFNPATGSLNVLGNLNYQTGTNPGGTLTLVQLSPAATALNFDGVNDYASAPVFSTIIDSLTIEARVMWNGTTGSNEMIAVNGNTGNSGYAIYLNHYLTAMDTLSVVLGGNAIMSAGVRLKMDTMQMVSLVRSHGTWTMYVDGMPYMLSSNKATPNHVAGSFAIGADQGGAENFNGTIDEVRLWGRPLCQDEINSHLSCQLTGNEPGLIALYHFNQGNASDDNTAIATLADSSGNGHNLTLHNFALNGGTSNFVVLTNSLGSFCGAYTPPTPGFTASGSLKFCQGDSVVLTADSGIAYNWVGGAGGTTRSIVVKSTSSYKVTITDPNGCYGTGTTGTINVTVNSLPVITVTGKDTLYQAVNDTLKASGGVSYMWTSGSISDTTLVSPTTTITYTVTGTDGNGCKDTASFRVVVDIITGIKNISLSGNASVYPNPANTVMNLSFTANGTTLATLKVVNITGAEILSEDITITNGKVMSIDISKLAPGNYFAKVITATSIQTVKFIKE